jgi:hypothetical protein
MIDIQTTFEIPDYIEQGLKSGEYIRVGGVIREVKTKQIVAMLREVTPDISQSLSLINQVSSVASILNLAVSVVGFTVIIKRLKEIEEQIEKQFSLVQENINNLHRKFDISVYANFTAALGLARDATTMKTDNRINLAISAINRFFEAQQIYDKYVDIAIDENINFADKYILSLSLTYLARARCYLELEEINAAILCLNEGNEALIRHIKKYIRTLLLSQPIDLERYRNELDHYMKLRQRLSQICKWLEPDLNNYSNDQAILSNAQERKILNFIRSKKLRDERFFNSLPPIAVAAAIPLFGKSIAEEMAEKLGEELLDDITKEGINALRFEINLKTIEQIIETYNRFESYLIELQAIQELGMSFKNWLQLTPHTEAQQYKAERIYIIPSQPLDLK